MSAPGKYRGEDIADLAARAEAQHAQHAHGALLLVGRDAAAAVEAKPATASAVGGVLGLVGGMLGLVIVWVALGVGAFIMSLVCFSKKGGTSGENWVGLLLALFLGPFYWLYYALGPKSYCKSARVAPAPKLA